MIICGALLINLIESPADCCDKSHTACRTKSAARGGRRCVTLPISLCQACPSITDIDVSANFHQVVLFCAEAKKVKKIKERVNSSRFILRKIQIKIFNIQVIIEFTNNRYDFYIKYLNPKLYKLIPGILFKSRIFIYI